MGSLRSGVLVCTLLVLAQTSRAQTASCSSGTCQLNFANGHSQKVQPLPAVGGQSSLTCATDADCQVLIHPSCPSFPICDDASDPICATQYQTVPDQNGQSCTLTRDVIIANTIVLPSFVQLDCAGFAITPRKSVSADCCPSNGTSCSSSKNCETSDPELAIFLNGAYGVTIQNCSIGASHGVEAPFDFGILSFNNKSDQSLAGDAASLAVLQNRIVDNPAIHARFIAVNLAFSDNTLIGNNPSVTTFQRGSNVVAAHMSSSSNSIIGNNISVTFDASGNFFTGIKRFPGPVSTSNPVYSCGNAINFAQTLGENATCSGVAGKGSGLASVRVNGAFYQKSLSSDANIVPISSDNTLTGNQITVVPGNGPKGGTFGLRTNVPGSTIVQNTFTGAFLAIGAAGGGGAATAVAGRCGADGPLCLGKDDCDNLGNANVCTPSGASSATVTATNLTIDGNQIFVPDYPTLGGGGPPTGIVVSHLRSVVTNNLVTLQGSSQQSVNLTEGITLTAGALEAPISTAVVLTGNSISRVTNALFIADPNAAIFGATISRNDLTGSALAVHIGANYKMSTELSTSCQGNFWGRTSAPGFDSSLVTGNIPLVVDSHPYTFSVATMSNPPIVDTRPPDLKCPSTAPTLECSASVPASDIRASDDCDPSPAISATPASFGASIVTWTAVDHSNNSATLTCPVTVVDTTPPAILGVASQTVVGNCEGAAVTLTPPAASDTCSPTSVTCAPLAGNRFGANSVSCTARDASGNQTEAILPVTVLEPLRVAVQPPLSSGAYDNVVKAGSTVPNKVKLYDCAGIDVTRTAPVTVKIGVTLTSASASSDFHGVGDAQDTLVLIDDPTLGSVYQFNLSSKGFAVTNHTSDRYQESISAAYSSSPGYVVGAASVLLDTK
jgi:hypothetical protein